MDTAEVETLIQSKNLNAPRITPADVEAAVSAEYSFNVGRLLDPAPGRDGPPIHPAVNLLTICVLVLKNGFTVTGESACASPENFDAEVGRRVARQHAVEKIWPLLGYALRDRLSNGEPK